MHLLVNDIKIFFCGENDTLLSVYLTCFKDDYDEDDLGLCLSEQEETIEVDNDEDYKEVYSGFIQCLDENEQPFACNLYSSINENNNKQLIEIFDSKGDYYSEKIYFGPECNFEYPLCFEQNVFTVQYLIPEHGYKKMLSFQVDNLPEILLGGNNELSFKNTQKLIMSLQKRLEKYPA